MIPETKTPPQLAKRWKVNSDKVRQLIEIGELRAFNVATDPNGRPRWRITSEAIAEFEQRRAANPPKKPPRRRRRSTEPDLIEYV